SDSEFEEETVEVTTGGSSRKTMKGKKVPLNVPPAPLDNISFHYETELSRAYGLDQCSRANEDSKGSRKLL
ncbi:hypothetical protein A2U01_0064280, partial [Trifolium medium]|nr:hypothetical protein [Trifolium medium]